ncbi:MAG: YciI family protein [Pyrinomonadaceae bacterium]
MKYPLSILFAITIFGLNASSGYAQVAKPAATPVYDAELAKRLGADDYGMKSYVFCILKTGPKDAEIKDKKQRDDIFARHMANMKRLADEGKLVMAGPFMKNERSYRGLFIFNVTTVEEAQKLVDTDPVIQSGMMIAELTPWYGSASLLATPEIHKKIAKVNP